MTMNMRMFLSLILMIHLAGAAFAEQKPTRPGVNTEKLGLKARLDTAAVPPAPKRGGYKVGTRVVYTIWIDNDDPYDGMRDVVIWMPVLPESMRLDLSPAQPAYGNIFVDSRTPQISDTPARCRAYYISRKGEELLQLTPETDSSAIRRVLWVATRGNSEQVVGPHDEDENMWAGDQADTTFGAEVGSDVMYVRYAAIVVSKPGKKK